MIPFAYVDGDNRPYLNLHPGQTRAWVSGRRFVFMFAGTQGGKTAFGPWWLYREIKNCGAGDYIAATSTFDLFNLKMLPALMDVFINKLRWGKWHAGARVIELCNPKTKRFAEQRTDEMWSRIILRSAASKGGLESSTAKGAWLDECGQDEFDVGTWEAVQRRLSINEGRVLGTTTLYNEGWLRSEIYDPWKNGTDKSIDVIQFASFINPAFPKAEFERMQGRVQDGRMQSHRFKMFYLGEFAQPPGMIYDCFDQNVHVVDAFQIPANWPRYIGIDFGAVNNCMVWLARDPRTGIYYAYRESLTGNLTTKEHVANYARARGVENVVQAWGGAPSETQQRRDWTAAGLRVGQPPVSDVEGGIDRVTSLIKGNQFRVFRHCKGIIDDLGTYKRVTDDAGNVSEEIENKRTYHYADSLRYVATGVTVARIPAKVHEYG